MTERGGFSSETQLAHSETILRDFKSRSLPVNILRPKHDPQQKHMQCRGLNTFCEEGCLKISYPVAHTFEDYSTTINLLRKHYVLTLFLVEVMCSTQWTLAEKDWKTRAILPSTRNNVNT